MYGIHRTGPDVPSDQRDIADLLQTVVDTSKDLSAKEATVKYGKGCGELTDIPTVHTGGIVCVVLCV